MMSAAFCRSASASGLSSALSKSNSTSDDKLISILNPVSVALKPLPCADRLLPWEERLLPCAERVDDADATADACSAAGAEALDASDAVWGIAVVLAADACACGSAGLGSCPQAHRVASAVIQASKRKFFIKVTSNWGSAQAAQSSLHFAKWKISGLPAPNQTNRHPGNRW